MTAEVQHNAHGNLDELSESDLARFDSQFMSSFSYADELIDSILDDNLDDDCPDLKDECTSPSGGMNHRNNNNASKKGLKSHNNFQTKTSSSSRQPNHHHSSKVEESTSSYDDHSIHGEFERLNDVSKDLQQNLYHSEHKMKHVLQRMISEEESSLGVGSAGTPEAAYPPVPTLHVGVQGSPMQSLPPPQYYSSYYPSSPMLFDYQGYYYGEQEEDKDVDTNLVMVTLFIWFALVRCMIHASYGMLDDQGRIAFPI